MKIEDEPGNASERMSVADVAQQEKVSKKTVHNWVKRGVLTPFYTTGKVIRFTRGGVERDLRAANNNGGSH